VMQMLNTSPFRLISGQVVEFSLVVSSRIPIIIALKVALDGMVSNLTGPKRDI